MASPAVVVAALFLTMRYAELFGWVSLGALAFSVDKWHLGVFRMLDFAATAAVAIRFHTALKRLAIWPLIMLGQASLQVFCVHLVTVFLALTIMGTAPMLSGWRVPVAVAASLTAQLLTAWYVTSRRPRKGRTEPSPAEARFPARRDYRELRPAAPEKVA
jgi:hypothetical protein